MTVIETITWEKFFDIQSKLHDNNHLRRLDGNIIHSSERIGLSRTTIELIEDEWYFDMADKTIPLTTNIVIVESPVFSDLKDSYHHIIRANCFVYLKADKIKADPSPMKNNLRSDIMSTIGNGVIVKTSNIQNAGLGLFADRDFEKNEPITFYDGKIIDQGEALELKKEGRATHIGLYLRHSSSTPS